MKNFQKLTEYCEKEQISMYVIFKGIFGEWQIHIKKKGLDLNFRGGSPESISELILKTIGGEEMRPDNLKRLINCFNATGSKPDEEFVRVKSLSENSSLVTAYSEYTICNVILDESVPDCLIHKSQADHLKADHKKGKKLDDIDISKYIQSYKEPSRDLDSVMKDTFSRKKDGFNINFKNLEAIYKAMKDKSTTIRIDYTDNDKIIVTNEHGDTSFIGVT